MNYGQHVVIAIGTVGLPVAFAQIMGLPQPDTITLMTGAAVIAAGAIAVDIDHPKAFISFGLPLRLLGGFAGLIGLVLVVAVMMFIERGLGALVELLQMSLVQFALAVVGLSCGLMLASWAIAGTLGHRGPLHSLVFALGATLLAVGAFWYFDIGLQWWWGLWFGWGWLSHILADGLTEWGVPLWWPLSDDRVHVLPYPDFDWAATGLIVFSALAVLGELCFLFFRR